jgi:hypothetical protein
VGVVTIALICEVATSSQELFFFERAKSVHFPRDLSNLTPFLNVNNGSNEALCFCILILTTGPKVVINVRLMTGPLINHDFEGDLI